MLGRRYSNAAEKVLARKYLYQAVHQVQASQAARILRICVHEDLECLRHLLLLQLSICRQTWAPEQLYNCLVHEQW